MDKDKTRQSKDGISHLGSPQGLRLFHAWICQPQDIALSLIVQGDIISCSKQRGRVTEKEECKAYTPPVSQRFLGAGL